jgi:hypothetical protein
MTWRSGSHFIRLDADFGDDSWAIRLHGQEHPAALG